MKLVGKFLDVYINPILPKPKNGVVVVVGTKISKKAVQRNLVKRRIKAAFNIIEDKFKTSSIKIVAKPDINSAKYIDIKTEIDNLLNEK